VLASTFFFALYRNQIMNVSEPFSLFCFLIMSMCLILSKNCLIITFYIIPFVHPSVRTNIIVVIDVPCAESTDDVKSRLKERMLEYIERAEKLKDCIQKRKEGIL